MLLFFFFPWCTRVTRHMAKPRPQVARVRWTPTNRLVWQALGMITPSRTVLFAILLAWILLKRGLFKAMDIIFTCAKCRAPCMNFAEIILECIMCVQASVDAQPAWVAVTGCDHSCTIILFRTSTGWILLKREKAKKGKGKGNYLTSVAKQAKTAFLHGPTV